MNISLGSEIEVFLNRPEAAGPNGFVPCLFKNETLGINLGKQTDT